VLRGPACLSLNQTVASQATQHLLLCGAHLPLSAADNPNNPRYNKGLVAEVSKFLFGEGFAITGGDKWRVRRRAVGPALHRCGRRTDLGPASFAQTRRAASVARMAALCAAVRLLWVPARLLSSPCMCSRDLSSL
jgi:hypothetical protein